MEDRERDELFTREESTDAVAGAGVPGIAIGGALVVGAIGAAVWAAVSITTDYEIGWIAWGIGAAIGAAYHKLGGRGAAGAFLCGAVALVSIGVGKYVAYGRAVDNIMETFLSEEVLRLHYEECKEFATDYRAAATPEERDQLAREWLSDEVQDASDVSDARVRHFEEHELPDLEAIRDGSTSYEEFARECRETVAAEMKFSDTLSPFDLLWILLGVGTAVRLARGAAKPEPAPAPAEPPPEPRDA